MVNDAEVAFMPADLAMHRQDACVAIVQPPGSLSAERATRFVETMLWLAAMQQVFRIDNGQSEIR